MSNRLLIKSVMLVNDFGVFEPEQRDSEGEVTRPRRRIQAPIKIGRRARVNYNDDISDKILKFTVDGVDHELPIDDYSLSLAGRD